MLSKSSITPEYLLGWQDLCELLTTLLGVIADFELYRVPPAKGYHQQSGLKCTGLRTIMRKAGLP